MESLSYKSIKTKLIFWFSIISILPLATVLIVIYNIQVDLIESQTSDKLVAIRDLKLKGLRDWLSERSSDLHTMSNDKELTDFEKIINNNIDEETKQSIILHSQNIINRYIDNYTSYSDIFILDPENGKVIVASNESIVGQDRSTSKYFTEPKKTQSIFFSNIYYSNRLSDIVLTYSIPIFCTRHAPKDIIGILVARINLQKTLYPLLSEKVGLGQTGETLIVNEEGFALNSLHYYENAPLNLRITAEPATLASSGNSGIIKSKDYRNEKVLAAYTYIPETQWGFVCKQDIKELNQPISNMLTNFVLIFVITVLLIYVIAFSLSKTISNPVVRMDVIAQKIRKGDFTQRININTKDELGSLAFNFNSMAKELESKLRTQNASRQIADVIVGKNNLKSFCFDVLKKLMEVTNAQMSTFYILNDSNLEYEHFASIGANEELLKPFSFENPEGEFGNTITTKSIQHLEELPDDTIFVYRTTSGNIKPKEIITIPVLVESSVIGIISLVCVNKFDIDAHNIVSQSWANINSSFSNLLSNERTRVLAEQLTRINQTLEQQAEELQAQSEELHAQSEELQAQNVELDKQRQKVEESSRMKVVFLMNISHELRTPLNSIMALSRSLIMQAKDRLTDEENNYLEIVERNGKQLLKFINDILDLSKIEGGKLKFDIREFSISPIIENVQESLQPIANEKNIRIFVKNSENIPKIISDESKVHQILLNIVSNSVKFTNEGHIEIETAYDSESVIIRITDTGIGIPDEYLPYIFDEFRQVDGSISRQYEGSGLGLTIANKIATLLKGKIYVKSKVNEGSTFTVVLPIDYNENYD